MPPARQLQETLEILVALAEFFQDCEEWDACAAWCERAILLATSSKTNGPYGSALRGEEATHAGNVPSGESSEAGGAAGPPLLASLLTLKGTLLVQRSRGNSPALSAYVVSTGIQGTQLSSTSSGTKMDDPCFVESIQNFVPTRSAKRNISFVEAQFIFVCPPTLSCIRLHDSGWRSFFC